MITGIVVALKEELSTLTAKKVEKGCITCLSDDVWLVYSGAGSENARLASELLIEKGVGRLISWGCAAALESSLQPGDLVLANSCVDANQILFELDNKDWINHVLVKFSDQFSIRCGRLAESKVIVETSSGKAEIGHSTGAIALDMESVAIASIAKFNGIPFLTIRAIADPLSMDLPKAVSYGLNEKGEVVLAKLLFFLLLHPAELPVLISLGIHFHAARKTLKHVAKELNSVVGFSRADVSI